MKKVIELLLTSGLALVLIAASNGDSQLDPTQTAKDGIAVNDEDRVRRTPVRDGADEEEFFAEDFENGLDEWTTVDDYNATLAWHQTDLLGEEDNLRWWCGDTLSYDGDPVGYDNLWLQYLDSPALDLSDAGDGLTLTFDAYWLIEDPRIVPPADPYDGWDGWFVMVSNDGGENFDIATPDAPDYQAERISATERIWGFEPPVPGWVFHSGEWADTNRAERPDVEWVEASFDLSEYAGDDAVVIRFALASDRAVAAPYGNIYLEDRSGVFLDNIVLQDEDEEVFLFNNADDDPIPDDLIPTADRRFGGDHWELTDETSNSGDWSVWVDDDNLWIRNALDSPPFEIVEEFNTWLEYWVFCDFPDADGAGNNRLEDFYQIFYSIDDGESWTYLNRDYSRPEAGGDEWTHYTPELVYQGGSLDLSEQAGETVRLRFLAITDGDDDGGDGDGLYFDDITVLGSNRQPIDVGMANFVLPYPTTVGFHLTNTTAEMHNYGTRDQNGVTAEWGWSMTGFGRTYPIVGRNLASEEFEVIPITDFTNRENPGWKPTHPGVFPVWTRTKRGENTPGDPDDDDMVPGNDSARFEEVRVWPEGLYEFGYDNRSIQFAYEFEQGTGPAARFSSSDAELGEFALIGAHFRFNGQQNVEAAFNLHIFAEGQDEQTPGEELSNIEVIVPPDSVLPNHMTVYLTDHEELQGLDGDFWFWIELQQDDNRPQIVGDEQLRGAGRFFSFDGENTAALEGDLMMHAIVASSVENVANLEATSNLVNFGEVMEGEQVVVPFTLYSTGFAPTTISSVNSNHEAFEIFWDGETTLPIGTSVTFDIVFTSPHSEEPAVGNLIIDSDDPEPPFVDLIGVPVLSAPDPNLTPVEFGLDAAYPNPFNSQTRIDFHLSEPNPTGIGVFDLTGRMVVELADGYYKAGSHSLTLDARNLPAGIYAVRLESGSNVAVRKIVLMK